MLHEPASNGQQRQPRLVYTDMSPRVKGKPNVVFIMVESYLSVASQMKIDGKEVTPCLNELMRDPRNYHNLNVTSNRGGGESSDAQISYFTGTALAERDGVVGAAGAVGAEGEILRNKVLNSNSRLR